MKKLLLFLFVLIVFSCHKNSPAPNPTEGNIVLKITNKVNGKIFALNQKYVTPANDTFYVTNYKYYISNLQLMNIDNGKYIAVPNSYYLFNAAEQSIIPLGASNIKKIVAIGYSNVLPIIYIHKLQIAYIIFI